MINKTTQEIIEWINAGRREEFRQERIKLYKKTELSISEEQRLMMKRGYKYEFGITAILTEMCFSSTPYPHFYTIREGV